MSDMRGVARRAASPERASGTLRAGHANGAIAAETARLYETYAGALYRQCLAQLRSREEAEDAVQNTFVRVQRALGRGVVPAFEAAWLFKIAHNVCLSRRLGATRRARVEGPQDVETLTERVGTSGHPPDELFGLEEALAAMPPRLRHAILLREWQGLSYGEIAARMDTSRSAVETLLFRARRHLAAALESSVAKPARRIAGALNLGPIVAAIRGCLGGAGAAKLAAGAVLMGVSAGGGLVLERSVDAGVRPARPAPALGHAAALPAAAPALRTASKGTAAPVARHVPTPRTLRPTGPAGALRSRRRERVSGSPASPAARSADGSTTSTPTASAPSTPSAAPAQSSSGADPSASSAPRTSSAPTTAGVPQPSLPSLPSTPLPSTSLPTPTLPAVTTASLPTPTLPTLPTPTLPVPTAPVNPPPLPTVTVPTLP